MYRCKHCTYQDYQRLVSTTDQYLLNLQDNDFDKYDFDRYFEFISDYDDDISCEIRFKSSKANFDKVVVQQVIREQMKILYNIVLVDIREHN